MTDVANRPARKPKGGFAATPVTSILGFQLRRAQLSVFQRFQQHFKEHDIRPAEYSVLTLIAHNPGCKQIDIARVLGIKRANFAALMNRLDARGWTERHAAEGDKRSQALFLTAAGEKLIAELDTLQAEFEQVCVDRLGGDAERDKLVALLRKLADL
ncbi:MarR family winged helix-turn-helix transcriptional regulator [Pelagibacterium xiamenense]|uniref:MarR family winged helix-turn-helix transcriptional regulator n=1 Tax=Pelagibacterium xiamenense TaxID=2901140 RepID=UPI001E633486|nr:MarR family winged helix-turn-helix transcriptional regulator [Pelagibacterium xiamenense]MCD7059012.1 MarR family winged helix-turn-helix transcriptional regulator [Pelagibacterium xiamenense]